MTKHPRTRRLLTAATLIAVLLAVYALAGFLVLPRILQQRLPALVQERLNGRLELASLAFNPFTLRLVARDVRVLDAHGTAAVTVQAATVDLQWSSLWERDWHLDEVLLDHPVLHAVLDREHRLNLVQLVRPSSSTPATGRERAPPRIVLDRAGVTHARVTFIDLTGPAPAETALEWIDLAVRDLTTRTDEAGRYAVSAVLPGGGALAWQGELSLQPVASRGEIRLADVPLDAAWTLLRERLRIERPQGRLTLALAYDVAYAERQVTLEASRIRLDLQDLSIAPRGKPAHPLLALAHGTLTDGRLDWRTRTLVFPRATLEAGELAVGISTSGELDWNTLFPSASSSPNAHDGAPFRASIDALELVRIGLRYVNRSTQAPMQLTAAAVGGRAHVSIAGGGTAAAVEVTDLALDAKELQIAAIDGPAALRVHTASVRNGSLSLTQRKVELPALALETGALLFEADEVGQLNWARLFATREAAPAGAGSGEKAGPGWRLTFPGMHGKDLQVRYVDRQRRGPLLVDAGSTGGTLDLAIAPGTSTPVSLDRVALSAQPLTVRSGEGSAPALTLASVQTRSGAFGRGELMLDGVQLRGGELLWAVGADGASNWQRLMAPPAEAQAPQRGRASRNAGLRIRVPAIDVQDVGLRYRETAGAEPLVLAARIQRLSLRQLDTASRKPATFALQARAGDGTLQADGKVEASAPVLSSTLKLTGVALEPLQPLLARIAAVRLRSGQLSATAQLDYRGGGSPTFRLDGNAQLAGLRVDEARGGDVVLAWKQAQAQDISFTSRPARLSVGNVEIDAPRGKLEITRDRKLNFALLLNRPQAAAQPATGTASARRKAAPLAVRVDRLHLADGVLHFADRSLVLPFERDIESLEATLVNLASSPGERTQIEAGGRIAPYGEAKANGAVTLAAPLQFTDIRAQFSDVKVPPLSPYTITFAGRAVAAGTLWLDIRYRIVNGQLEGTNNISIQDLQLGERVQARKPIDLPLDLAVALLTDDQGRFRVSVPVRGNLRNPHFDYASVIGNAITDTLGRVVAAPFHFVGQLFGGGERLQAIAFPVGSAQLAPPEQDKLNTVARMLKERPRVALAVRAGIAPGADAQAMREEIVAREIARRSGIELRDDEDPGPVPFSSDRTRRAIAQLASERLGGAALGTSAGPGAASNAYYESLYRRLVQAQPLPALDELGRRRNQSVVDYLAKNGVPAQRIAPEDPRQVQATQDEVETQLRLRAGGG
jgi:hypothetical protein